MFFEGAPVLAHLPYLTSWASFKKCCVENVQSFLKCASMWFRELMHKKFSLPDVKSINHKLSWSCTQLTGFKSMSYKRFLNNVILAYKRAPINSKILYLEMASGKNCLDFQTAVVLKLSTTRKMCVWWGLW